MIPHYYEQIYWVILKEIFLLKLKTKIAIHFHFQASHMTPPHNYIVFLAEKKKKNSDFPVTPT